MGEAEHERTAKARARRGGRAPVDDRARGVYIEALSRGATHAAAAAAAGFSRQHFAKLRRREPEFGAMCDEAVRRSEGPRFVAGGAKRRLQLRRNRRVRFDDERKRVFLSHFVGTANLAEAAAAAGVSESTVWAHCAKDPDFARAFRETLEQAYLTLDTLVLARRIEAQRKLLPVVPTGEPEPEFERAMKLLQRWDRRGGGIGRRPGHRRADSRWDFDEAIALLEKKLTNMGIPIEPLPPGHERPDGQLPLPPPGPEEGGESGGEGEP